MKNWQPVALKEGQPVKISIGDLEMKVTMEENLWITAYRYRGGNGDYIVTRIHLKKKSDTLYLKPSMPDRPVVVDFENQVRIVTGHRVCFLVPIPLTVDLSPDADGPVLMNLPSVALSNTWFGDHFSGILSYSLKTHPIVSQSMWQPTNYEALCPVEVMMESQDIFSFRRICLYAQYLGIYRKGNVFWNEGVVVDYPAESEVRISLMENKPSESDGYVIVSLPRESSDRTILERSMTLLRRYTGL